MMTFEKSQLQIGKRFQFFEAETFDASLIPFSKGRGGLAAIWCFDKNHMSRVTVHRSHMFDIVCSNAFAQQAGHEIEAIIRNCQETSGLRAQKGFVVPVVYDSWWVCHLQSRQNVLGH